MKQLLRTIMTLHLPQRQPLTMFKIPQMEQALLEGGADGESSKLVEAEGSGLNSVSMTRLRLSWNSESMTRTSSFPCATEQHIVESVLIEDDDFCDLRDGYCASVVDPSALRVA